MSERGNSISSVEADVSARHGRRTWPQRLRAAAPAAALALAVTGGAAAYADHRSTEKALLDQDKKITALQARQDRIGRITGDMINIAPGVIDGSALQPVTTLPGTGRQVSEQSRLVLEDATVKLVTRNSPDDPYWLGNCTATKIAGTDGQNYLLTAAHCIDVDSPPKGAVNGPQAINVTQHLTKEYAVIGAEDPETSGSIEPIARVTGVAIDQSATADIALLAVQPAGSRGNEFTDISALDARNISLAGEQDNLPVPGQQVILDGAPQAAHSMPVEAVGTYLGRVNTAEFGSSSISYDLAGVVAPQADHDPCNYGGSGSQMAYTATSGATYTSGPLALRNNIGYNGDSSHWESEEEQMGASLATTRLQMESSLGVNLDMFATVCEYSVPVYNSLDQLQQVLAEPDLVLYPPMGK